MVELHLLRAANQSLKWGMTWAEIDRKDFVFNRGKMTFHQNKYEEKYLAKNQRRGQWKEFRERCSASRALLRTDYRHPISKHDFYAVLAEYLPKVSNDSDWHKPEIIAKSLAGCLELPLLDQAGIYREILQRAKQ